MPSHDLGRAHGEPTTTDQSVQARLRPPKDLGLAKTAKAQNLTKLNFDTRIQTTGFSRNDVELLPTTTMLAALCVCGGMQTGAEVVLISFTSWDAENGTARHECVLDMVTTMAKPRSAARDRKSTRLNSSHITRSRMPSSA